MLLHHFTRKTSKPEVVLQPTRFGENEYTKHDKADDPTPRVYFYAYPKGRQVLDGIGAPGWYHYVAEVPDEHIYDADKDPEGHRAAASSNRDLTHRIIANGYSAMRLGNKVTSYLPTEAKLMGQVPRDADTYHESFGGPEKPWVGEPPVRLGKLEAPGSWQHDVKTSAGDYRLAAHKEPQGWVVSFYHQDPERGPIFTQTGHAGHKAVEVLRGIHAGLKEFVQQQKPDKLHLTASGNDSSRMSLYHKAMPLIAKALGYDHSVVSGGAAAIHTLTRPSPTHGGHTRLAKVAPVPQVPTGSPHPLQGLVKALQDLRSKNQQAREWVSKRLLQEAGEQGSVHGVIAYHPRTGYRASVATFAHTDPGVAPRLAPYLGAYQGLLSQDPETVAFVTGQGPDLLHHIHVPQGVEEVAQHLHSLGLTSFVLHPESTGTLAHVYDQGGRLNLSGIPNAHINSTPGTGTRLGRGQGTDADSRSEYREAIEGAERGSGASGPTGA